MMPELLVCTPPNRRESKPARVYFIIERIESKPVMILIKLGGSVITDKSTPLKFRPGAVSGLAGAVSEIMNDAGEPIIAVHGGGSFGHHYSVIFDMHTRPDAYDPKGVATVKNSMMDLNHRILDIFLEEGALPYCFPPSTFVHGHDPVGDRISEMAQVASLGMCPVTFGDAVWCGSRTAPAIHEGPSGAANPGGNIQQGLSYILSGDRIMTVLAEALRPRLAVFATDVDGLYASPDLEDLIAEADEGAAATSTSKGDVTGGMGRKVQEAAKISASGTNVFFVNGNKPERIISAVTQNTFEGTIFRSRP